MSAASCPYMHGVNGKVQADEPGMKISPDRTRAPSPRRGKRFIGEVESFAGEEGAELSTDVVNAQKKRRIAMVERRVEPLRYPEYLQLDKLLSAQHPTSGEGDKAAHDEHLFIITHQVYELWFKQILHDLDSVRKVFLEGYVEEKMVGIAVERLRRVTAIQHILLSQLDVLETMTPMNFLDFRDFLFPASGFQSHQFRLIENKLGLPAQQRMKYGQRTYCAYLMENEVVSAKQAEAEPSLHDLVERWLSRTPFLNMGNQNFWRAYGNTVDKMFEKDRAFVRSQVAVIGEEGVEKQLAELNEARSKFDAILHEDQYQLLRERGEFRLSFRAMQAALLITLYQDEPILRMAHDLLTCLLNIDEQMAIWRYRHSLLAQRMLGLKMGTGGSSGYAYLRATAMQHRVFKDLFNMASFLIPRAELPPLSDDMKDALSFCSETTDYNRSSSADRPTQERGQTSAGGSSTDDASATRGGAGGSTPTTTATAAAGGVDGRD